MSSRTKLSPSSSAKAPETAPAFSEPLHIKYRPRELGEVIGQPAIVKSLKAVLKAKARPHTFLFTGPGGTGKTTLARILAQEFGCDPANLVEVDAASNSGIDDMRAVTSALRYNGFGTNPNKAIILDECHGLSKNAWDSLLKSTEEPPPHVFFFFCSTVPGKIPQTMVTRCQSYQLNPVRYDDLMDLLEDVSDREKIDPPKWLLPMVADAAQGSARGALTLLSKVADCEDKEEASSLLAQPLDNAEVIDLCRLLVSGKLSWSKLVETLKGLEEVPAETIRIIATNYLGACLLKARDDREVPRLLDIARCFAKPCNPTDKLVPILLAFGAYIYD